MIEGCERTGCCPCCWLCSPEGFDSPLAACRRLLGFGPDAEVLEPAEVRQQLLDKARRTADRYGQAAI